MIPRVTIEVDDDLALKSGFIQEFLDLLEKLNNRYYDKHMPYPCNVLEIFVEVKGKIAISKEYGNKK